MDELFTVVKREEIRDRRYKPNTKLKRLFKTIDDLGGDTIELDWEGLGYINAISCSSSIYKFTVHNKINWTVHRYGDRVYLFKKERPNGIEN